MLHNTTRENLLQYGRGCTALIIDALYDSGMKHFTEFTYKEAARRLAYLEINPKLLRRGLADALFEPRGRRDVIYRLPSPSSARNAVNASYHAISDVLPEKAFKSLHEYRKALHHALIARRPGIYKRDLLARRLGVSKKTTRNYDKVLGHYVLPTLISRGGAEFYLNQMTDEIPHSRKLFLALMDVNDWVEAYLPFVRPVALKWLQLERKIEVFEQIGNDYKPMSPAAYYAAYDHYVT